jgi:hypothetical protein
MRAREMQLQLIDQLATSVLPPVDDVSVALSPRMQQLHDYWQAKRGRRTMPARRDIDPAEIKALLPHVIIADLFDAPLRVRYRLAGTRVCESFGFNIAGCWLHELDVTSDVAFWTAQYERMMLSQSPVYGRTTGTEGTIELFRAGWALFPLSNDGTRVDQCLEIEDWTKGRPTARFDDSAIDWQVVAFA